MNWTISRRITSAFALGFALVLVIAAVGDIALRRTARSFAAAVELEREILAGALRVELDMRRANLQYLRLMLTRQPEFAVRRDSAVAAARQRIAYLRAVDDTPQLDAAWVEALNLITRWDEGSRASIAALSAGDDAEALRIREEVAQPTREALDAALGAAVERVEERSDATIVDALETARRARVGLWVGTLLALLTGAAAASLLTRFINRPLRVTSHVLATSANEILAATTEQASGANQSLAAVTETAATVDEVVQTAEQSAQRARAVASSSQHAAEVGRQGRAAVERSMAVMAEVKQQVDAIGESMLALADQAEAIGEIIATVNDLADQTNLLALNAGIEAARAGDHGRGFGVVASEIKNLAEESKAATVRVRQILGDVQRATSTAVLSTEQGTKKVAEGMRQVTEAGETIRSLADSIADAAQAAAQISASAGQQSTGMGQIREAIANIQQAAQQNLAATRQAEAAARDLNRFGRELLDLIGRERRETAER